jgi:anaerobic selenocysteine-containing dehydrogenase
VFPTVDGRARFVAVQPREPDVPAGRYRLSTRRGKQFNSMVFEDHDPLTGAERDAVFVSRTDAADLGLEEGTPVVLRSPHGEMRGRVHVAPIQPGNVQAYWPEANVLIGAARDGRSGVPDYNALVELEPASR